MTTIEDLGWTEEEAVYVRGIFGAFAEDWDDPAMDIYDKVYKEPVRKRGIKSGVKKREPIVIWDEDDAK